MPLAAAAGLLAVVGGSAVAVAARQPAPVPAGPVATPTPGPGLARQLPPDAVLVSRCVRDAGGRPAQLRAVFSDARGYLAWVAGSDYGAVCAYRWDGTLDGNVDSGRVGLDEPEGPRTGHAPATGAHLTLSVRTQVIARSNPPRAQLVLLGQVARDVARVDARWDDRPKVTAAVRGPYYLARVLSPLDAGKRPLLTGSATAYDRDGRSFGPIDFIE